MCVLSSLYYIKNGNKIQKRLCCNAGHQGVSRCRTGGESEESMRTRKHASKGSTVALKRRTDVTRSLKQGFSGPTKRTDVLQLFFF